MKGKSHYLVRMLRVSKDTQMIHTIEEEKEGYDSKIRILVQKIEDLRLQI